MNVKEFEKRLYNGRLLANRRYSGAQLHFNFGEFKQLSSSFIVELTCWKAAFT